MLPEVDLATASRASLELAIVQASALPASVALTAYLSASHERLSELCEQAGDFKAALLHHRCFHQLSLQGQGTLLLDRSALLQGLQEFSSQTERLGAGLCLVALEADGKPASKAAGAIQQAQLADLLRRQCRPEDLIAHQERGSGNALLLVLHDVDLASARKVCERVRSAWPKQSGGGSLSMGLSAWRGPADELTRVLERAESALTAAQRGGGNCLRSGSA
jgi:GGDEF domain-containing protein